METEGGEGGVQWRNCTVKLLRDKKRSTSVISLTSDSWGLFFLYPCFDTTN